MTTRGLVLLLFVLLALLVGYWAGYRARVSEEIVVVHPRRMLPPVPGDLAIVLPAPTFAGHAYPAISPSPSPAPTASPKPDKARPRRVPAAGHTSSGSGARTRRPSRVVSGVARWHGTGRDGYYAAAGCRLRRAIGKDWRGRHVLVAIGRRAIEVRLNDAIGRLPSGGCSRTLIDLSDEAFAELRPLSQGVIRGVAVGW